MKKLSHILIATIIITQQVLVVFAQGQNTGQTSFSTPDLTINNTVSYSVVDQGLLINAEICQSSNSFQGNISTAVQAKFQQSAGSVLKNVYLSNSSCTAVEIIMDKNTFNNRQTDNFEMFVDPSNIIPEASEYNNTYVLTMQLDQAQIIPTPDFYIKSIYFDELSEKIEVSFCQKNQTDLEIYFPYVSLEIENQIFDDKKVKLGTQGAGNECFTTRRHKDSVNIKKSGTYKVRARIDQNDDFTENNEQNNRLEQVLNIKLRTESSDEQSYILNFDFLKNVCKYNEKYIISHCGDFEELKTTINKSILEKAKQMTKEEKNTILQNTEVLDNKVRQLENDFPYTLEEKELQRKQFIFEYSKYAIIMMKYYVTNSNMDNFINDMLK